MSQIEEEKWLICGDPDSYQIYTLNINTNQYQVEQDYDICYQEYRKKVEEAIKQIEDMLKLKSGNWLMASKYIDQYRRRKIPSYLLHKQASSIPTYLCQSTLSQAFSNVDAIKLRVRLDQYKDEIAKAYAEKQAEGSGSQQEQEGQEDGLQNDILEIEPGLVTGADEVIKSILREVYIKTGAKLKPSDPENKQFILQIAGLKEYLTGNHPMLSYDRVRVSLRGIKHLEVILTEVKKQSDQTSLFPPMVTRQKGEQGKINWQQIMNVPVLLWYAPEKLPPYDFYDKNRGKTEQFSRLSIPMTPNKFNVARSYDNLIEMRGMVKSSQDKNRPQRNESQTITDIKNVKSSQEQLLKTDPQVPLELKQVKTSQDQQSEIRQQRNDSQVLYKSKEVQINDLVTLSNQLSKVNSLKLEKNITYSGECDWPFSLRICSLENLIQAFEQDSKDAKKLLPKNRATYNGLIPPRYITKQGAKQEIEVNKKPGQQEEQEVSTKQVHFKLHKRTGRPSFKEGEDLAQVLKFIPFGGVEHLDELAHMQEYYGLDFLPYLISVQVSLYHGSKLLTSWSQAETKKQPFSAFPKFYQTITFPGIKISQLPQEARLCFNIIVHSATGQQQIIGSTSMYIFDDQKRFKSSMNPLNVWPFYKVDPRLLCMGQYWGVMNNNHNDKITHQFVSKYYARLLIQLDQFSETMKWSLRDEKQMEELGFPKSAKCQRYYQMKNQPGGYTPTTNLGQKQSIPNDTGPNTQAKIEGQSTSSLLNQKKSKNFGNVNFIPQLQQRQNTYDQQDSATIMRFDAFNDRNQHFAPSFVHLQQGSSYNVHDQSSSQLSTFRISSQFSAQSIQSTQSNFDNYNQAYPYKNWSTTPRTEDLAILQGLLKYNPLNRPSFTEQHKYILMICRNHYKTLPYALQIFLMAIEWDDPEQVREAHNMIKLWTPLPPEDALPLLDAPFADETVRLYAVERVSILSDDELQLYMLELTQCLMFEKHLFNPLAEMLLERSLQNPWVVGHELFWLLKAQLHVRPSFERYVLVLEQLLMLCGEFRTSLINEVLVEEELNIIAQSIKSKDWEKQKRMSVLQEQLETMMKSKKFSTLSFALDSRMESSGFKIEDCKVMDSKKLPLWLAMKPNGYQEPEKKQAIQQVKQDADSIAIQFKSDEQQKLIAGPQQQQQKNQDDKVIQIIFKNGDDIRQDMLTLQLIKIMDKIWLDAGEDFRMKPYKTISTQDNVGMIEVVTNSTTIEKIHQKDGILGAFQSKTIWNHLKEKNTDPQNFETATVNFLRSCAGYCVATYVLGIGDRHSGNIMITDTGHLFHIDFGHFLGNFKEKFGFKRERTKFVLTEEMAFVMGGREGDMFKQFEQDCTNAYNYIRKHGHFLLNIFLMNLSAGMPELQHEGHIRYIEDQLALSFSDQEATAKFKQEIITSLNDTWRQLDNWFHNLRRGV